MGKERVENQIALFFASSAHGCTRVYARTRVHVHTYDAIDGIARSRAETIEARNDRASRDA